MVSNNIYVHVHHIIDPKEIVTTRGGTPTVAVNDVKTRDLIEHATMRGVINNETIRIQVIYKRRNGLGRYEMLVYNV